MTLFPAYLSIYDPAVSAEGGIDPLSLQPTYERLAERIFPFLTVRMRRPRFLTAMAGGWAHSLGLRADRPAVVWGSNESGECNVPSPNSGFVSVSRGRWYSIGLKADGSVVLWGGGWSAWRGKAHWTAVR